MIIVDDTTIFLIYSYYLSNQNNVKNYFPLLRPKNELIFNCFHVDYKKTSWNQSVENNSTSNSNNRRILLVRKLIKLLKNVFLEYLHDLKRIKRYFRNEDTN